MQTFNDGVVEIYCIENTANPGDMPKDGLKLRERLHFKRRTVGVERYNMALQNDAMITELIRCPLRETVSLLDIAMVNGTQYRIRQLQFPEDMIPPVMDLSLSCLEVAYEV